MALRLVRDRTIPQRVDFYSSPADLLCFAMAMSGQSTQGIYLALHSAGFSLTHSQINYRIGLYERKRRDGSLTQRRAFREGKSPVAMALVAQIMGNRGLGHIVKATAVQELEKKRLYEPLTPKGNGIMKDESGLRRKRA